MKREIKFRVWDNVDYMSTPFVIDDLQIKKISFTGECQVMQFTGLKDENGKEIFEGDLHLSESIMDGKPNKSYLPILFENGAFWIDESFEKNGTYLTLLCEYGEPLNIQGNIHENPEL